MSALAMRVRKMRMFQRGVRVRMLVALGQVQREAMPMTQRIRSFT